MRKYFPLVLAALLFTACGLETEPNPNHQAGTGGAGAGSGANGGTGATDGGDGDGDGGGTGGTTGGSGGFGGTGGTGGTGGNTTDCTTNAMCSPMLPQCNAAGDCVSCTSNAACEDRDPLTHCEMTLGSDHRGHCVACLEDEDCAGNEDGEYCNNNACVPCKTNADCDDLSKPQCGDDGQCTGCTENDACEGRDGTEACVTAAGPKRGHCVACVGNEDCDDAALPQCGSDNVCGACTAEAACTGRDGKEHCNLREDAETFGQCVECTGATEDEACGDKSCKQTTGECTEINQGDVAVCGACQADSECSTGAKCVPLTVDEVATGHFCLYSFDANDGCADTRPGVKPYSVTLASIRSIDSLPLQTANYCAPAKSCEAVVDAIKNEDCEMDGAFDNTKCGLAALTDGQCLQTGTAMGTCSYGCAQSYECPQNKPTCSSNQCTP